MRAGVRLRGVTFRYPTGAEVLRGIDLEVGAGERVAILGPNGAGKSTLLLHLNGVLGPGEGGTGAGTVEVGGVRVGRRTLAEVRRRVGIVFQDPDDQLFMPTVGRDVAFGPENLGWDASVVARTVADALASVALSGSEDRAPDRLSQGERRRAALAGVLAMDPDVLVLDEPTANLDPRGRREFGELVAGLDVTVLLATHDLPFALALCPRSVILAEGHIVADAATRDLLRDSALMARYGLELPYGYVVSG